MPGIKHSLEEKLIVVKRYLSGESATSLEHEYSIDHHDVVMYVNRYARYGEDGLKPRVSKVTPLEVKMQAVATNGTMLRAGAATLPRARLPETFLPTIFARPPCRTWPVIGCASITPTATRIRKQLSTFSAIPPVQAALPRMDLWIASGAATSC